MLWLSFEIDEKKYLCQFFIIMLFLFYANSVKEVC